ncbi:MAG: hypothetical protein WCI80_01325 [Bacteroidota bacterium]
MEIINLDKIETVSLPFSVSNGTYTYTDAIVGTPDYINNLTQDQILAIQQERFTNWLAYINGE